MNKNLAYILGVMASDGHNSTRTKANITILSVKDEEFVDKYIEKFEAHFKIKPKKRKILIKNKNASDVFSAYIHSKKITNYLGSFYGEDWHINIQNNFSKVLDDKYFWEFLSGFFDGDGSIDDPSVMYRLRLHIGYNEPAFWLKNILKQKGFETETRYRYDREEKNIVKSLAVSNIETIIALSKKIKSSIPRKEERLERFRKAKIYLPKFYQEIDYIFSQIKLLKEENKSWGATKIKKHSSLIEYNIPITTVNNWLYRENPPTNFKYSFGYQI